MPFRRYRRKRSGAEATGYPPRLGAQESTSLAEKATGFRVSTLRCAEGALIPSRAMGLDGERLTTEICAEADPGARRSDAT